MFDLPHRKCNKHLMTPKGLIGPLYSRVFGKVGRINHMATFYYLYRMYSGKEDGRQVSDLVSLKISLSLFKTLSQS